MLEYVGRLREFERRHTTQSLIAISDSVSRLENATAENKFGVLQAIYLKEKMVGKGVASGPECWVLEI